MFVEGKQGRRERKKGRRKREEREGRRREGGARREGGKEGGFGYVLGWKQYSINKAVGSLYLTSPSQVPTRGPGEQIEFSIVTLGV